MAAHDSHVDSILKSTPELLADLIWDVARKRTPSCGTSIEKQKILPLFEGAEDPNTIPDIPNGISKNRPILCSYEAAILKVMKELFDKGQLPNVREFASLCMERHHFEKEFTTFLNDNKKTKSKIREFAEKYKHSTYSDLPQSVLLYAHLLMASVEEKQRIINAGLALQFPYIKNLNDNSRIDRKMNALCYEMQRNSNNFAFEPINPYATKTAIVQNANSSASIVKRSLISSKARIEDFSSEENKKSILDQAKSDCYVKICKRDGDRKSLEFLYQKNSSTSGPQTVKVQRRKTEGSFSPPTKDGVLGSSAPAFVADEKRPTSKKSFVPGQRPF